MAADEPSLDLDLDMYREMAAEARRAAHRLCGLTEVVFISRYNVNLKCSTFHVLKPKTSERII